MKRPDVLALLALASCESAEAPAACGPIPDATVNVGETTTAAACFNDRNGDVLSYSVTSSDPGVATAYMSDTTVTVTAVAPGDATVTVTASDPGGLEGQQDFSVTVPNRAPEPNGAMPPVTVAVGRTETVDASSYFTEPDGETLAYSAVSSDTDVATVSVSVSTVTVTALAEGTSSVTVTTRDPGGLAATQTFQVTVPNAPQRLTNDGGELAVWSPDGEKIAFVSFRDGDEFEFEIYVMDADGDNEERLTDSGGEFPEWSPDGEKIAFQADRDGDYEIYVMDADGDNEERLTDSGGELALWPPGGTWSPDGEKIAFMSFREGDYEIYVMEADGDNEERLTDSGGEWPVWSPDGEKIAFMADRDGDYDIYLMDADGDNEERLTESLGNSGVPAWSPDGDRIAFQSDRAGDEFEFDIYVIQIK